MTLFKVNEFNPYAAFVIWIIFIGILFFIGIILFKYARRVYLDNKKEKEGFKSIGYSFYLIQDRNKKMCNRFLNKNYHDLHTQEKAFYLCDIILQIGKNKNKSFTRIMNEIIHYIPGDEIPFQNVNKCSEMFYLILWHKVYVYSSHIKSYN